MADLKKFEEFVWGHQRSMVNKCLEAGAPQ